MEADPPLGTRGGPQPPMDKRDLAAEELGVLNGLTRTDM